VRKWDCLRRTSCLKKSNRKIMDCRVSGQKMCVICALAFGRRFYIATLRTRGTRATYDAPYRGTVGID
jgi:hypothetical protein